MTLHRFSRILPFHALFWVWIVLSIFPSFAIAEPINKTIQTLQETYQKINDIEADFSQTVTFEGFEASAASTGKVFLKKNDAHSRKMRWDYTGPASQGTLPSQQIFIDGETLLHYTPHNEQVVKSVLGKQTGLPIDLFMEMEKIEAIFSMTQESDSVLLLKPKNSGSNMSRTQVTLFPLPRIGGLFIQKVTLHEENGNVSQFTFKNFKINKKLPDSVFSLKIPEGVEVIDLQ